jgi:chemotaxis protein CheX
MKVEYVSPFVQGAMSVLNTLLNITPERGHLTARPQMFTTQQVNIVVGVTGMIEGQVIYGMSVQTADKVAGLMLGQPVVTFDQLAASAIAELGNMISGSSMGVMSTTGFICDITPPTIIRGSNVRISTLDIPALVIPLKIEDVGVLEINVSLQERRRAAA